jgi:2-(1,2-epoxy-1,2-dihydrophenyl)acetyl-CoA isomerase
MSDIITKIENGVARLTLNRPESRNAMRPETTDEIRDFLLSIEHDRNVGCVIIDAAGEHFSAGGDVKGFAANASKPPAERGPTFELTVHRVNPVLLILERMPQIVIASARGFIAGSGVSFVGAADLAIVSDNAKFILAHIKIGGVPDAGASYYLPRQVGVKRAKEIVCLGGTFDAAEAYRIGLVNRVVANDQLEAETNKLAASLGSGPRLSLGEAKRLVNISLDNSLAEQLNQEAQAVGRVSRTADFIEGATSFAEKRKAVYKGQ